MKKANVISGQQGQFLSSLAEGVDLYFTPLVSGAYPSEVVFVDSTSSVSASLDYQDLEFKFECLFFEIAPYSGKLGKHIGSETIGKIFCVSRCEWKLDEAGARAVFGRGKVESVPDGAIVMCSTVGLLLVSADGSRMLVYSDDDFPLSVGITKEKASIDDCLKECDVVDIERVSEFRQKLVAGGFDFV